MQVDVWTLANAGFGVARAIAQAGFPRVTRLGTGAHQHQLPASLLLWCLVLVVKLRATTPSHPFIMHWTL